MRTNKHTRQDSTMTRVCRGWVSVVSSRLGFRVYEFVWFSILDLFWSSVCGAQEPYQESDYPERQHFRVVCKERRFMLVLLRGVCLDVGPARPPCRRARCRGWLGHSRRWRRSSRYSDADGVLYCGRVCWCRGQTEGCQQPEPVTSSTIIS